MNPAEAYAAYLEDQSVNYGLTEEDLRTWSPPAPAGGAGAGGKAAFNLSYPTGRGGVMTALLRDLIEIPDRVLAGDFVLTLSKGIGEKSTIDHTWSPTSSPRNSTRRSG